MLKLLERNIASIEERLVPLAPSEALVPDGLRNVTYDNHRHGQLVRELQQLRGSVYLEDGAVGRQELSPDGLHQTPEDERSWHLLMMSREGRVSACAWFLEHPATASIRNLRVRKCPLGSLPGWRQKLHSAVHSEIDRARRNQLSYAEVGGWAVARECRCTSEGLLLALAAYSLGGVLGGALGITTATVRHSSSKILRRLGGSPLPIGGDQTLPSYFDPKYNCEMELLRFDSRRPSEKYAGLVELLRSRLGRVSVIASRSMAMHAQPQFASRTIEPMFAA